MSKPSELKKAVARHTLSFFGGTPTVQDYENETHTDVATILFSADIIEPGITSIGTVGLSEYQMVDKNGQCTGNRVELCAAAPIDQEIWKNVVASSSFYIRREKIAVRPGTVLPKIFLDYAPSYLMPNVYLTVPFLWGDLKHLLKEGITINWLQCISIYDAEMEFVKNFGGEAFENLLQDQDVDIFDMSRKIVSFE